MNSDQSSHTQPPKPRWRPRFSLRTLMIGVLLIGFSWSATVMWGPTAVQASSTIPKDSPGWNIQVVAPFVVTCHFNNTGTYYDETWIWFFGYTKLWSGTYRVID